MSVTYAWAATRELSWLLDRIQNACLSPPAMEHKPSSRQGARHSKAVSHRRARHALALRPYGQLGRTWAKLPRHQQSWAGPWLGLPAKQSAAPELQDDPLRDSLAPRPLQLGLVMSYVQGPWTAYSKLQFVCLGAARNCCKNLASPAPAQAQALLVR